MLDFLLLTLWALATAPPPLPAKQEADPDRPKLIAKDKGYFIHALPSGGEALPKMGHRIPFGQSSTARGLVLLHTSVATGEMKILTSGGTSAVNFVVRNSDGTEYYLARIAGVAVDKDRLFVLRWDQSPRKTSAQLLVFRPDTGELVHSLELTGEAVPQAAPRETADLGTLRLHPDGVSCYGTRFAFDGTKLLSRSSEKKP